MIVTVLVRTLRAGTLAGCLSGVAGVLVFVAASVVHPGSGGLHVGELLGATLNYLVLATLIGAAAGAALAVPVGLALGALRPGLTGRPARARTVAAFLCAAAVLALGATLAVLGTAPGWLSLLVLPALAVATAVGAWRGPLLVDGPRGAAPPAAVDPGRHRRR